MYLLFTEWLVTVQFEELRFKLNVITSAQRLYGGWGGVARTLGYILVSVYCFALSHPSPNCLL